MVNVSVRYGHLAMTSRVDDTGILLKRPMTCAVCGKPSSRYDTSHLVSLHAECEYTYYRSWWQNTEPGRAEWYDKFNWMLPIGGVR